MRRVLLGIVAPLIVVVALCFLNGVWIPNVTNDEGVAILLSIVTGALYGIAGATFGVWMWEND